MPPFFVADELGDAMGQARRAVVLDLWRRGAGQWRLVHMARLSNDAGISNGMQLPEYICGRQSR